MAGFIERRKYQRIPKKVALLANVCSGRQEESSHDIAVETLNLSRGGVMVSWPKGWHCPDCKKCLSWIFNKSCHLKNHNNGNGDSTKPLPVDCRLQVRSQHPQVTKLEAEVAWVDWDKETSLYSIGLRFLTELPALPF